MVPIPLNDHIRRQIFWFSVLALLVANVWVFLFELSLGRDLNRAIFLLGIIPARYTTTHGLAATRPEDYFLPLVVSMFLHGGWIHLIGNMLFLFVFGRSIEDRYGHLRFLALYLLSGLGAAVTHIVLNAGSRVPTIGASGAIAGVLGAYFVCFPGARITTLIPFFFIFWTIDLPAMLLLGYWFLIQFLTGFRMLAIESATGGGVAWWAHVGGFVTGMLLALALRPRQPGRMVETP